MDVKVTARHVEFSEILKEYAAAKAERLSHFFDSLRKVEVILDREGHSKFRVEFIASAVRGKVLVIKADDRTAMAAVDEAASRMERRLRRFKERLGRKHPSYEGREAKFNRLRSEAAPEGPPVESWW